MLQLRDQSCTGGIISRHRALAVVPLRPLDLVVAWALAIALTGGWLGVVDRVCSLWAHIFEAGRQALRLPGELVLSCHRVGPCLFRIPCLTIPACKPDSTGRWVHALALLALLAVSFRVPKHQVPLIYLLRAVVGIQASALLSFALMPHAWPAHLGDYMLNMLTASLGLMSIIPLLLGFTYYIFDFSLLKKLSLTLVVLLHFCLSVPLQCLLAAYVMARFSVLLMPLLYMVFGLPLQIMIVVAFYGWGMSWRERSPQRGRQPAAERTASPVPPGWPLRLPRPRSQWGWRREGPLFGSAGESVSEGGG